MSDYYMREALLEQLEMLQYVQECEIEQMIKESQFLQECYESRMVVTTEAVKSDASHGIVLAVQSFLDRITSLFRKSAIASYKSMLNDDSISKMRANMNQIKANCEKLEPQKVMPYWGGHYIKDAADLQSAMRTAFNSVKAGKIDYKFAEQFVKETDYVKNQDTRLGAYLKNYFRYGDNNMSDPRAITLTGKELAGKIEDMLVFMEKYPTDVAALPGKVSDAFSNQSKTVKLPGDTSTVGEADKQPNTANNEATKESLTPDTYLLVEDRMVCETMLPLFMGYSSILEAEDKQSDAEKKKAQDQAKEMNSTGETGEDGKPKSATTVEPADGTPDDKTDGANGEEKDKKDANAELKEFLSDVSKFFQLAVAAYNTSLEERFTVYGKLLRLVAKEYMQTSAERKRQAASEKKKAIDESNQKRGLLRRNKKK